MLRTYRRTFHWTAGAVLGVVLAPLLAAAPSASDFAAVQDIFVQNCAACHDWTSSRDTIVASGRVTPGNPEQSLIWQKISTDEMPATDQKLTADQKTAIRDWIAAGAPGAVAGTGAAASRAAPVIPPRILYHAASGFTSTALLGAAGVIGVVHYLEMKNTIHPGGVGEDEGNGGDGEDFSQMTSIWQANQSLRWWHVGLVGAGETLYLSDAITGLTMLTPRGPGPLTRHDIHRYAFFTHLSLMAAQIVLGFLETEALSQGWHEAAMAFTGAHAVVGVAIPAVMLFAGLENILP